MHRGMYGFVAVAFLLTNIAAMSLGSVLAIAKKHTALAVGVLAGDLVLQAVGYGLLFDLTFFLRSLSVFGGLLMLLADSFASQRKPLFAGLPNINENDKSMYVQLFGRILLVFLTLSSIMNMGQSTGVLFDVRMIVSIIGVLGCILVVVGFKAKYSAWMLITFLSITNVIFNNWWSLHQYTLINLAHTPAETF